MKLYLKIGLLLICFLSSSCDPKEKQGIGKIKISEKVTSISDCFFKTQITKTDDVKLHWGKNNFSRTKTLNYDFSFTQIFCGKNYMILSYGCGSPCWAYILLPFNKNEEVINITYPLKHNQDFSIILSGSEEKENELIIYNFKENKKSSVILDSFQCLSTFYTDCFDVVFLDDKVFTIELNDNKKVTYTY